MNETVIPKVLFFHVFQKIENGSFTHLKSKTWMNLVSTEIEFDFDRPYLNPHGFQILIFNMFAMNISNQYVHRDFLESF